MRPTIVCVDDEWAIRKSLNQLLKQNFGSKYDIEFASNGREALALCSDLAQAGRDIPLVISDQSMPGITGDRLLIQLHALYPATLKIMLTGKADAENVGNAVNLAQLYRYIEKPWDETDLVLTVTEALRRFWQEKKLLEQNTLLKTTNARLESSLALLLATFEATADGILALDNQGQIVSFNRKFAHFWNLDAQNLSQDSHHLLKSIQENLSESDAQVFQSLFWHVKQERNDYLSLKNGRILEYYLQPYTLEGEVVGRVWSFRDVTEAKESEVLMKRQALYDSLTNLPNRILLNQKFVALLTELAQSSQPLAVMFLDLDRFKQINDTLGHHVGDLLLKRVVQRLEGCLRSIDFIARWGGDEFVLLLPQLGDPADISAIAERLIAVLQHPFSLAEHTVEVTASIGIALYPENGLDEVTLLTRADKALYQAKHDGRGCYRYYSPAVNGEN
ncbi:MAG: diguanylate cyclase [Cyanobacteria bacterium P01_D01_bin.71]